MIQFMDEIRSSVTVIIQALLGAEYSAHIIVLILKGMINYAVYYVFEKIFQMDLDF